MSAENRPDVTSLITWLTKATSAQKHEMFELAGTTFAMARQFTKKRRGISVATAAGIESATHQMALLDETAPEPVTRGELNATCMDCSYYKKCTKK
jgi:hypothetical protein